MKKIITSRNAGKTSMLISISAENGNTIVCSGYNSILLISRIAKELGMVIPVPITYRQFIEREYKADKVNGFLIDNVEHLIQKMTTVNICAITMSIDDGSN